MTAESLRYVPPHNFEAEQSLLGGLMLNSEAFFELRVSEADFYSRPHRLIFAAIARLMAARQPLDITTVRSQLAQHGVLEECGGFNYLVEIAKNTPSAANVLTYGAIVRNAADRRFAVARLHEALGAMMEPSLATTDERFARMNSVLADIDTRRAGDRPRMAVPASDIYPEWLAMRERYAARHRGELTGFATGIRSLDELLYPGGINETALIVLGARPKVGKTSLMACMCNHTALVKRLPVVGFSLEMTREQLLDVMVSQASGISREALKRVHDLDVADKAHAVGAELANAPLFISDTPNMTIHQVVAESRRLRRQYGQLGLICLDYLTLMTADKAERNDLAYGNITRALKQLTKEMNCPVLLLTQLNRGVEQRADKRPYPSDSRDTGQIEQDCDIWIGCYRDEIYNENSPLAGVMELLVRLHRDGRTGVAYCRFKEGVISHIDRQEVERLKQIVAASKRQSGGWGD